MTNKLKILVVVHGSRGRGWVAAQEEWFDGVRRRVERKSAAAVDMKLTYLEITEPLFEDALAAQAGAPQPGPVLIYPFFLSRSGHAGEEIPEIAEARLGSHVPWQFLRPEGWPARLGANSERRLAALGATSQDEVVVCGYGASKHDEQWRDLLTAVQAHAGSFAEGRRWRWAPCGHFLPDASEPLRGHLREVTEKPDARLAVLPLFLGVASYQKELIPGVLAEFPQIEALFQPDAILPDPAIEEWAAEAIARAAGKMVDQGAAGPTQTATETR